MSDKIDIVTVVNDYNQYNQLFRDNANINHCYLIHFDNTLDNIWITKRYNSYLENDMPENTWVVFCHQDFEFSEDIRLIINESLKKDTIYGPVGAKIKQQYGFFIRMDGLKIAKFRLGRIPKQEIVGSIYEKSKNNLKRAGKPVNDYESVQTVDCCCFIVHSDLLRKLNYRFDENLDWHLYAEDFCLSANKQGIESNIINIKSIHYSSGNFGKDFDKSLEYLKKKHNDTAFVSTCYDGAYEKYLSSL